MAWYKGKLHNLQLKPETRFENNVFPAKWIFTIDVADDTQATKKSTYQFSLDLKSQLKPLRLSGASAFKDLIENDYWYEITGGKLNNCLSLTDYDGSK